MRLLGFAVLVALSPVFASVANSQTIDAAKRCETIQDKQSRIACFAQAGVPVIECARPSDADEAVFCQNLAGSPNSTSASTVRPATVAPAPIIPAQPIAATDVRIVPRGDQKPSFDCAQAKAAAARLICADAELAQLDGELGVAFQKQKARILASDQAKLVAEQLTWIRDRNTRCDLIGKNGVAIDVLASSKACMVSAIQERIAVLAQTKSTVAVGCHRDGDVVTIQGAAISQSLELANGSVQSVWLLVADRPICLLESSNGIDAPRETSVSRFQIIGQAPPSDTAIELTGKLSTGNISQYYAEPTAISVISGHRIAALSPPNAPLNSSKFDANEVAALLDKGDSAAASPPSTPAMPPNKQRDDDFDHDYQILQDSGAKLVAAGALKYDISGWHQSLDITLRDLSTEVASVIVNGACNHTSELRAEWSIRVYLVDGTLAGECKFRRRADDVLADGAAALEKGLREQPWMEGYLRAAGINPRTGPMPPLSPAETRCHEIFGRSSTEGLETWKQELNQCVADLRQEWMASH
jgi:uncharacterized protein YecT (DUF1311 family)